MTNEEKIKLLGSAVTYMGMRLLRYEKSEKYKKELTHMIYDIRTQVCEIKDEDESK